MSHQHHVLARAFYDQARAAMHNGHDADDVAVALFTAAVAFGSEIGGREMMAAFIADVMADLLPPTAH